MGAAVRWEAQNWIDSKMVWISMNKVEGEVYRETADSIRSKKLKAKGVWWKTVYHNNNVQIY